MNDVEKLVNYTLQIADNSLVLGHRISEWCGHGPVLEQDIALTNIALDLVGQSRTLYQYAATLEGGGKTEDDYPYLRDIRSFRNVLLVELPNNDFGYTIVRQFFFDNFHLLFLNELMKSSDEYLAGYAQKSLKEVKYHQRYSSEWLVRLGDGTEESHQRVQQSIDDLWSYRIELLTPNNLDREMAQNGIGVDIDSLRNNFDEMVKNTITQATLTIPEDGWNHSGGKDGIHTEHLGFILAELQYMQRAYPGLEW